MTEAGSLDSIETRDETVAGLPGVRKGDLSLRREKPELRVSSVAFSPTGGYTTIHYNTRQYTTTINLSACSYSLIACLLTFWNFTLPKST